jgi:transcriptional regulator with XRE-family HTH domain
MKQQLRQERGRRARQAREAAGLSQSDFAELVGCSRQLIGSIEAGGAMSVEQLEAYCTHGKCTAQSIVFGTPEQAPPTEDDVARQFAQLDPWLRERLWPLYQVFVRPGAKFGQRAPGVER